MDTLAKHTITGWEIAYPADYWEVMKEHYPTEEEQRTVQHLGFDHFGRGERCFRCGFLCEGEDDDVETVAWSSSNPTGEREGK